MICYVTWGNELKFELKFLERASLLSSFFWRRHCYLCCIVSFLDSIGVSATHRSGPGTVPSNSTHRNGPEENALAQKMAQRPKRPRAKMVNWANGPTRPRVGPMAQWPAMVWNQYKVIYRVMLNIYDADGLLVSRWYDIVDEMRACGVSQLASTTSGLAADQLCSGGEPHDWTTARERIAMVADK